MQLKQRINAFFSLGKFLKQMASENNEIEAENNFSKRIEPIIKRAEAENGWFTSDSIKFALNSWAEALSEEKLEQWTSNYKIESSSSEALAKGEKSIAIIMAGNIPLVGFHDFISVLITGNKVLAKLSSNDKVLLPFIVEYLISVEPELEEYIAFTDGKLENFDAVIATGSNNSSRYFDYYFGKYPNIIRKNRNSVAVLTGNETERELQHLADDIFQYFGLGCRNVSKIYVPENYDFKKFFEAIFIWKEIIHNNKYINNYDYNKAVYLMDGLDLLDNEFLLLKKDSGFSSPISVVFYEKYSSLENVEKKLKEQSTNIQCLVSTAGLTKEIPFGEAQSPQLWNYADAVDTVDFLLKLQ